MSVEVESERDTLPAQSSLLKSEELCLDEWRNNVRACVTSLKCHIMATKGLTPDGHIIEPYSPDILLKNHQNEIFIKDSNKDDIDSYVAAAMAKLPSADHNFHSDVVLEDVRVKVDEESSNSSESAMKDQYFNIAKAASFEEKFSSISLSTDSAEFDEVDHKITFKDSKELKDIKDELSKKVKEVEKLSKIRDEVESELQELTANLFQEAHNMVLGANQRAAIAEKSFKEAKMQVEVLQAEVVALKALVITSTPSAPNHHLHPQLISKGAQAMAEAGKIFHRGHKKSPSDFDLKYGRDTTPPSSPLKDGRLFESTNSNTFPLDPECWEVDPVLHREFVAWRQEPDLSRTNPFINRVHSEDIDLCLAFPNSTLAHKVQKAIEENALYIEEVNPRQKSSCPKKCVLLDVPRYCKYRFRLGDKDDTWYYISQLARNRIISVCDFLSYLRYIQLGLVKSSIHDVYWEIVKLRRQMALARLGF